MGPNNFADIKLKYTGPGIPKLYIERYTYKKQNKE